MDLPGLDAGADFLDLMQVDGMCHTALLREVPHLVEPA